ncbi:putative HTH transcriptional regulator [Lactobacillus colini]|uniref:HTH transcriptional regulator n=1 Tax=Lactobacillus colini TaxID=1819254 RepID=A0ABS4MHA3_9LACO|nr:ATP-binding protein [Lactobacillus colini]MBP2058729.1 putative HTH transcriptional regulator [Lactobacillus colini]
MNSSELLNLITNDNESETVEYKTGLRDAKTIGQYISALGNSALEANVPKAYLIWGVEDRTKKIVGTSFDPYLEKATIEGKKGQSKKSNIEFIFYLNKYIDPKLNLIWDTCEINGKKLVCLTIDVSHINQPLKFMGIDYIRVGSSNQKLNLFPEKERRIWESFESSKFELEFAKTGLSFKQLSEYLNLNFYIHHINEEINNDSALKSSLIHNNIVSQVGENLFNITNLGAYTFAKDLHQFTLLQDRSIFITRYRGNMKLDNASYNEVESTGIIVAFDKILKDIMDHIPYQENYDDGPRKDEYKFPKIAIRELLANALVHQDFTISGMRPMVEIFDNRVVFSNPGIPLIEPLRFLDVPPRSRNPELANILSKFYITESRGTGIDKVVYSLEKAHLPAIEILSKGTTATQVTIREKKSFKDLSATERNAAIYWDASLKYVNDLKINNASIRKSFGLNNKDTPTVSKAITSSIEAKLIKPYDENTSKRFMEYIPYWGISVQDGYQSLR